jgi:FtsH-binding integral membrane protein
MIVDLMHLTLLVIGIALGAWSLVTFRTRLPRGRFAIFGVASVATLFGCAAVGGEIGLMSQSAWFSVVVAFLASLLIGGYVTARHSLKWR